MKEVAYEGEAFRREEREWEQRKMMHKKLREKVAPAMHVRTLERDLKKARRINPLFVRKSTQPTPRYYNTIGNRAPKKNLWTINNALLMLVFVFALSVGIGAYALFDYSDAERPRSHWNDVNYAVKEPTTTPVAMPPPRPETREAATLDVTDSSHAQITADIAIIAGNTYLSPGSTREIRPIVHNNNETTPLSAPELLSVIAPKIPSSLLNAVSDRDYHFGLVMTEKRLEGFLILSVNSYPYAAGGMREWERTLAGDILPVLSPWRNAPAITMISKRPFSDLRLATFDTRAILDEAGDAMFLYTFLNQQTLIFTTSSEALTTLLKREEYEKA